jgi:uncharacterized integral membrane protein (TIGR00697 family)
METKIQTDLQANKLLPVFSGIFTGVLILSNILASKMVQLGPFIFDGGTLLFPISYIFGDVLTEVYGYKQSRKVIWTGFAMLILLTTNIWIIGALPAEPSWGLQDAFDSVLLLMPRIALASILGYFAGEYSNAVVLSRLKVKTGGKHLWIRTITSTLLGEGIDSFLFVAIAFAGVYSLHALVIMALSNYLFKTVIEVCFTPVTYAVVHYTKRVEGIDVYDYGERYNPLPLRDGVRKNGKQLFSLFSVLMLVTITISCKSTEIDEQKMYKLLVSGSIPEIDGQPNLTSYIKTQTHAIFAAFEEEVRQNDLAAQKAGITDFAETREFPFTIKYDVGRNDDQYLSLIVSAQWNAGGAHGNERVESYTWNLKEDRLVALEEVLTLTKSDTVALLAPVVQAALQA